MKIRMIREKNFERKGYDSYNLIQIQVNFECPDNYYWKCIVYQPHPLFGIHKEFFEKGYKQVTIETAFNALKKLTPYEIFCLYWVPSGENKLKETNIEVLDQYEIKF